MPNIPGFRVPVPGTPYYAPSDILDTGESPMIYTTDGPLPSGNGISFTRDSMVFDPSQVTEGDLDSGTFGDQS
jgi:hypothetical protein